MITEQQFIDHIHTIGEKYEKIKDLIYMSDIGALSSSAQEILGELSSLRDTACIALRESHVTQNFNQN